jgi:hypothetical protein
MSTLVTGSPRTGTLERSRTAVRPPRTATAPDESVRCQRRRTMRLFAAGAAGLVPWTVVMAVTLPAEHQVHQWRLTWAGFDVLLIAALTTTAVLGRRRHPAAILTALLTAVLLICDAWFDVSLDVGSGDIWLSAGMALFVELPVAAVLIHRAYSVISSMPWPPRPAATPPPLPLPLPAEEGTPAA